ncbi:MAG TPA: ABC transporter ATP-binding protein [Longimicrobiales bacterium]
MTSGSAVPEVRPEGDAGMLAVADEAVLVGDDLRKVYHGEDGSELVVLDGVAVRVRRGEVVAVVGASGAGKSTLLHLLGGLDRPSVGTVTLAGERLDRLDDVELARARNANLGFVFQFHHLLREFNALENVMMPQLIAGRPRKEAETRARELLEQVGLGARTTHRPWQLSGGEQQRVAVARALANRPLVVLADEPSGNLDTHTSEKLHDLFFRLRAEHGVAMMIATHNRELADRADRVLRLREGRLEDLYNTRDNGV